MKIGIAGPVLAGPALPPGPAPSAGARYATCSSVGADGTRRPACAARAAVHGPAHRTALLAVSTPPSADRRVTWRPSSATDVTRNPVLTGGAAAASAASAWSADVTQDSGSSRTGPPAATPGNRSAA